MRNGNLLAFYVPCGIAATALIACGARSPLDVGEQPLVATLDGGELDASDDISVGDDAGPDGGVTGDGGATCATRTAECMDNAVCSKALTCITTQCGGGAGSSGGGSAITCFMTCLGGNMSPLLLPALQCLAGGTPGGTAGTAGVPGMAGAAGMPGFPGGAGAAGFPGFAGGSGGAAGVPGFPGGAGAAGFFGGGSGGAGMPGGFFGGGAGMPGGFFGGGAGMPGGFFGGGAGMPGGFFGGGAGMPGGFFGGGAGAPGAPGGGFFGGGAGAAGAPGGGFFGGGAGAAGGVPGGGFFGGGGAAAGGAAAGGAAGGIPGGGFLGGGAGGAGRAGGGAGRAGGGGAGGGAGRAGGGAGGAAGAAGGAGVAGMPGRGICASPDTLIATPDGDKPIASLREGDLVYSMDHRALRAVPILVATRRAVHDHHVIRVTLSSGARLEISGPHPTADGRSFGELRAGDTLDGHPVVSAESVPYTYSFTYDILPDSDSGTYFAGGALIGSTLGPVQRAVVSF